MARQTRNRQGPGTVQHRLPVPTATELPARPATVLTSVCALGFPALAFSRSSSKGISMSAFMGPLPRQKQTDRTSRGWSCHLSEWTGHRSGRQAWSSASRGNQVSGAWGCREDTPQTPPPVVGRGQRTWGQQLSLLRGCPRKDEGPRPGATIAPRLTAARTTAPERPEAQV